MRKADLATLDEVLDRVAQAVEVVVAKGIMAAMNEFNRRENGRDETTGGVVEGKFVPGNGANCRRVQRKEKQTWTVFTK